MMKLIPKIIMYSFAIVFLFGALMAITNAGQSPEDFFVYVGSAGFFGGALQIFIGLSLLFAKDKRYAQGFFISGGLLMLIGFATCTSNFRMGAMR